MKTCTSNVSTPSATIAEGSYVQDSNAALDARRNRSLRHGSDVGKSISGTRRFQLPQALFAFVFGILSMLLPSIGRSQTVEELQQQISQRQADKETYQGEIASLEDQKAALEAQMAALDPQILQQIYESVLEDVLALIDGQKAEREELEQAQLGALNYIDWLELALDYLELEPDSPTYVDDLNFITGELLATQAVLQKVANRLNQLDMDQAQANAAADQAAQMYYGAQAAHDALQQQIDAIQAIIDSDNQAIQDIDSQIAELQAQIDQINNM